MRRMFVYLVLVLVALSCTTIINCSPAAAGSAQTGDFPEKGKTITLIVPFSVGGGTDLAMRTIAPGLEQELGIRVQVVNKPGASSQIGLTELTRSKPDGYTLGVTILPTALPTYLDPARKAAYTRKSFQPVGQAFDTPYLVVVNSKGPYQTLKDVIDTAKAKPETIKAATTGLMAIGHLTGLLLEKAAGVRFAFVNFDGSGPAFVALLGGHVEAAFAGVMEVLTHVRSGNLKVLAVTTKEETPDLPGVRTAEAQGYKVYMSSRGIISAPAGTPKNVVNALGAALKKVTDNEENKKKLGEILGNSVKYLTAEQASRNWDEEEPQIKALIEEQARK